MSNEQITNQQPGDVEAHGFRCQAPAEDAQDVEAHSASGRFEAAEPVEDVEAHAFRYGGRHEEEPPAKPGTEGRDDDVEAHNGRWG